MNLYRILAIASVFCLVNFSCVEARAQHRRTATPPPVILTVDTQGLTVRELSDLRCLSLNVYYEARGTHVRNQVAVAQVVRNRQIISKQTVCQVVYSPGQFTWTQHRRPLPAERDSWVLAQNIALMVMYDRVDDITRGATHFHEHRMRPSWARRAQSTVRIGAHTFHRIVEVAEAH